MLRGPESYIDGREVTSELQFANDQVLAIDVLDRWAAVFQFSLAEDGWHKTNTTLARRSPADSWEPMSSGGMTAMGWETPWSRPPEGWSSGHLLSYGTCGNDVDVDDETECLLLAASGFASLAVQEIRVTNQGVERTVLPAPTGAFVAVGLGNGVGFLTLTPFSGGVALSTGISFPEA